MDDIVLQALAKWPHVPDCYGWLGLDARGNWFMRDAQAQAQGALAVVQDPDDAEIGTMPRAALARCTPDLVLPLAGIRTLLHNLETH